MRFTLALGLHSLCVFVTEICAITLSGLGRLPGGLVYQIPRANPPCVASCYRRADGNYPSCYGCTSFATCSNGLIQDNRPCVSFGGLYWDDEFKMCVWSSHKCYARAPPIPVAPVLKGGACITSCNGLPDGDYQSCRGCDVYITCSQGHMFDYRPCPWTLRWDDGKKYCAWRSQTCDDDDDDYNDNYNNDNNNYNNDNNNYNNNDNFIG